MISRVIMRVRMHSRVVEIIPKITSEIAGEDESTGSSSFLSGLKKKHALQKKEENVEH